MKSSSVLVHIYKKNTRGRWKYISVSDVLNLT
jgi:hypothetical protein